MTAVDLVAFTIGNVRYGVRATDVVEVVRAAAYTPLPGAPSVIEGVIDVRGTLVPVLDARGRFGHPSRPLHPTDHFIVARAGPRQLALHVDGLEGLVSVDISAIEDVRTYAPGAQYVEGVAKLPDGLVLIHDLATFLSASEAQSLDVALATSAPASAPGTR